MALDAEPPTAAGVATDGAAIDGAAIDVGAATAADGPARPQRRTATQTPTRVLVI
jgi:hypothetical protein